MIVNGHLNLSGGRVISGIKLLLGGISPLPEPRPALCPSPVHGRSFGDTPPLRHKRRVLHTHVPARGPLPGPDGGTASVPSPAPDQGREEPQQAHLHAGQV